MYMLTQLNYEQLRELGGCFIRFLLIIVCIVLLHQMFLLEIHRKKSSSSDASEAFRQILNRYRKRSQENAHKVCTSFFYCYLKELI